jgi:hypothetical protein
LVPQLSQPRRVAIGEQCFPLCLTRNHNHWNRIDICTKDTIDGVDAAWVETDGETVSRLGPAITLP